MNVSMCEVGKEYRTNSIEQIVRDWRTRNNNSNQRKGFAHYKITRMVTRATTGI